MALRATSKISSKSNSENEPIEAAPLAVNQQKRLEERYRLQVDRQTKKSFTTLEAAEAAGRLIKNAHAIVQVSVYDAVDFTNKTIEADAPA
jgi:adenylyl- and sulfurtransferase ThiI